MIIPLYSFILSSIHLTPLDKSLTCINTVLNSLVTTVLLLPSWIPNSSGLAVLKKITTYICKILWKFMEVGGEMVENWHDLDFQVWIRLSEWRRKPVSQRSTKSRGIGAKEILHGKSVRSFTPGFVLVTRKEKWSKVNRLHRSERSFRLIWKDRECFYLFVCLPQNVFICLFAFVEGRWAGWLAGWTTGWWY